MLKTSCVLINLESRIPFNKSICGSRIPYETMSVMRKELYHQCTVSKIPLKKETNHSDILKLSSVQEPLP